MLPLGTVVNIQIGILLVVQYEQLDKRVDALFHLLSVFLLWLQLRSLNFVRLARHVYIN